MTLSAPRKALAAVAVRHLEVDDNHAGQRLDNFLLRMCQGVPKSHIYKAIRSGQVRVNRGRCSAQQRLVLGDTVRVPPLHMPEPNAPRPVPPAAVPIVHEDDALLVVDKPAGLAVHGGSGLAYGLIEQLRAARPEAKLLELAHRLDRDTSGLLVVAKKRQALVALHQSLREGTVSRRYQLLVTGRWANDRQHLRAPLLKWLTVSGERRVRVDPDGKPAHTVVTVRRRFASATWLEAELHTGRTHQIRVHVADQGHPIVGDDKYGDDDVARLYHRRYHFRRMFLHAGELGFIHPLTGEPLRFVSALPAECSQLLDQLSSESPDQIPGRQGPA